VHGTSYLQIRLLVARATNTPLSDQAEVATMVDRLVEELGADDMRTLGMRVMLGLHQLETGALDEAERSMRDVLANADRYPARKAEAKMALAQIAAQKKNFDEALGWITGAIEAYEQLDPSPGYVGLAEVSHGQILLALGRREDGQRQLERARAFLDQEGPAWWRERRELMDIAAGNDLQLEPFPPERMQEPSVESVKPADE
jgi:predicted negative regulator of RcsB-dependent stress response